MYVLPIGSSWANQLYSTSVSMACLPVTMTWTASDVLCLQCMNMTYNVDVMQLCNQQHVQMFPLS
jgi:hypothetical protein